MATAGDFAFPTSGSGQYWGSPGSNLYPQLARVLRAIYPAWAMLEITGTEPTEVARSIIFGDTSGGGDPAVKLFRLRAVKGTGRLHLQRNDAGGGGTDAVPVWIDLFVFDSTGSIMAAALTVNGTLALLSGFTVGGNLNMAAQDIVNADDIACTTLNGWSPSAHATRHNPATGADPLATGTPVAPGASALAGSSGNLARADHVHPAVASIDVESSGSPLLAAINIDGQGSLIATKVGQSIILNVPDPGVFYDKAFLANQAVTAVAPTAITGWANITLTGANGTQRFRVSIHIQCEETDGTPTASRAEITVHMGAAGTTADPIQDTIRQNFVADEFFVIEIQNLTVQPATGQKLTIAAAIDNAANTYTIHKGSTVASLTSWIEIVRIP